MTPAPSLAMAGSLLTAAASLPRTPLAVLPSRHAAHPRRGRLELLTEGLMLDPVYPAKALALVPRGRDVIFWPAGGVLDAVAAAEGRS